MRNMREKVLKMSIAIVVMIIITLIKGSMAEELHYVGGKKFGWYPGVNLSEWSASQRFYVHDWLFFGFDKNQNNVLEVNKTSYDQCIARDFVHNVTRGGRDVVELKKAQKYYFIDGRGFCYGGLKVMVDVHSKPLSQPPPPLPSPPPASDGCAIFVSSKILSIIVVLIICFVG